MKVCIVGRSNVGKSYLFNSLCQKPIAITENELNTTRDYIGYNFNGVSIYDTEGITEKKEWLRTPSAQCVEKCDLILFVVNAKRGIDQIDREMIHYFLNQKKQISIVVNQFEGQQFNLPNLKKYLISEKNDFDEIRTDLGIKEDHKRERLLIGIIGRCNSGKSTLFNALVGFKRSHVSDKAGTTRDSVIEGSKSFDFIDTAGYRTNQEKLDDLIKQVREKSLAQCDGIVVLIDGSIGITRIDKQLIEEAQSHGKFAMIVINKLDLIETEQRFSLEALNSPSWIPVIKISAKNRKISHFFKMLKEIINNSKKRISKENLKYWLEQNTIVFRDSNNNQVNIKYIIQDENARNIFKYSSKKKLSKIYEIALKRKIVEFFKLTGMNIKLHHIG